jgi:hypothetical protein
MDEQEYADAHRQVIEETRNWITKVVIGCHFCPFAAREMIKGSVRFRVEQALLTADCLEAFREECARLDGDDGVETTLLIFPNAFPDFNDYWGVVAMAEKILKKTGRKGVYQVASFHPLYRFAQTQAGDAANYTNRSPYPMLHLLREKGIWQALLDYKDPQKIPERNIQFTREKGADYMQQLREACFIR